MKRVWDSRIINAFPVACQESCQFTPLFYLHWAVPSQEACCEVAAGAAVADSSVRRVVDDALVVYALVVVVVVAAVGVAAVVAVAAGAAEPRAVVPAGWEPPWDWAVASDY